VVEFQIVFFASKVAVIAFERMEIGRRMESSKNVLQIRFWWQTSQKSRMFFFFFFVSTPKEKTLEKSLFRSDFFHKT
jgi:hypothetical protein